MGMTETLTQSGTTRPGKFWVYEQIMRIPFYGISFVYLHHQSQQQNRVNILGSRHSIRMTVNVRKLYNRLPSA